VETDPRYFRPTEVDYLEGDATKARVRLKWEPTVGFRELAGMMVQHDLEMARQEVTLNEAGHRRAARGVSIG
jgi:GDPmannose 4,6-dehydratase